MEGFRLCLLGFGGLLDRWSVFFRDRRLSCGHGFADLSNGIELDCGIGADGDRRAGGTNAGEEDA